jgi:hypothetical protein
MRREILTIGLCAFISAPVAAADPATIDWSKVPQQTVTLFYPGQSSYEWLRDDHKEGKGAKAVRDGRACLRCHEDEEKALGEVLVKGGALEPTPVKGKAGSIDLKVQAAYDATNAYLRFQWRTQASRAGSVYPYYRFDGKEWKIYGYPKLDKVVQEGKQPGIYEDRLSLMIDDGKVQGFSRMGCWLTCHDGMRDMPKQASREEAQKAIGKNDVRKYLPASRTNPADWRTAKPTAELAKIKAAGGFADLVQWRAHRSNPVGGADDGFVLEYRNFDAGKNHFASNLDEKKQPRMMFDPAKFKTRAVTAGDIGKRDHFLIKGVNAVAFDPAAGWKEGDMLPRYYLQPQDAAGSAADNKAIGAWKDGEWTVVIVRPLGLANADDKAFKEGGVYNVGFAVHDDNITTRGHHVSFPRTLGFGADAQIRAVKLP